MRVAKESNLWGQETNGWGPGDEWLESNKQMAGAQETNGWGPGNQWLGHRKPMVGVQEING